MSGEYESEGVALRKRFRGLNDKIPRAGDLHGVTMEIFVTHLRRYYYGGGNARKQGTISAQWGFKTGGYGREGVPGSPEVAWLWKEALRQCYWVARNSSGYFYARTRKEMLATIHIEESQERAYRTRATYARNALNNPHHLPPPPAPLALVPKPRPKGPAPLARRKKNRRA